MNFTLIDDFKTKYPRYWSVWCTIAAVLLSALELLDRLNMMLPLLEDVVPPGTYVGLAIAFKLASLIARAIKQSSLAPDESQSA